MNKKRKKALRKKKIYDRNTPKWKSFNFGFSLAEFTRISEWLLYLVIYLFRKYCSSRCGLQQHTYTWVCVYLCLENATHVEYSIHSNTNKHYSTLGYESWSIIAVNCCEKTKILWVRIYSTMLVYCVLSRDHFKNRKMRLWIYCHYTFIVNPILVVGFFFPSVFIAFYLNLRWGLFSVLLRWKVTV